MISKHEDHTMCPKASITPIIFVGFLLFLWSKGLMLKVFEIHQAYDVLKISANFLIVITTGFLLITKSKIKLFKNFYFRAILAIIFLASLPTFLTGTFTYGQDPIETLRR